ncbi:hypothetical protein TEA_019371 [Camellia sinensis var. sinensis]|uniref:hydroxymethylglutaryl-CoA reductase (NADPH) n=1 Tax=Camellia sinensis var. sinensis TaxID=542762 RepID=A0A4S4EF90_CAMSN|nr:hypothetical protein TEA_019371 [Camellia sinensis var. sinensis]
MSRGGAKVIYHGLFLIFNFHNGKRRKEEGGRKISPGEEQRGRGGEREKERGEERRAPPVPSPPSIVAASPIVVVAPIVAAPCSLASGPTSSSPILMAPSPLSHNNNKQLHSSTHPPPPSSSAVFAGLKRTMDVRRRNGKSSLTPSKTATLGEPLKPHHHHHHHQQQQPTSPKASDAFPLPLYLTNAVFFSLFFSVGYFLLLRWRDKIRNSIPLHVVTLSELAAVVSFIASAIYLLGFFGIDFVQSVLTSRSTHDAWEEIDEDETAAQFIDDRRLTPCAAAIDCSPLVAPPPKMVAVEHSAPPTSEEDEEIINSVVAGTTPSYSLESKLGDCKRAAAIRREALQRITGKSLVGLPLEGFDYESILGQCCEMPVGYVQIPVGIVGPLLLDGEEYSVPMATTEGTLVASTNRGCKAIYSSGGATSVLLRDGMTRAPVVRFGTAKRAAELKFFLEDPINSDTIHTVFNNTGTSKIVPYEYRVLTGCGYAYRYGGTRTGYDKRGSGTFGLFGYGMGTPRINLKTIKKWYVEKVNMYINRSSRFARLQGIQCAIAGKNLYMRFRCSTGDAMGMNMVSKGVQNVLDFLQSDFPDMDVIGISGNFCSDKKPAAVNWIEGRGKSVVCEAIITEEVVRKVLKTNVAALVELNMLKNLTGSAMAGALGGFNAHASNIVSAVYLATGQDPAQNVESSHCITMMEPVNDGKDLHVSVTMPSIEVGTVGGGTQLASQSACLNLLGVKGASRESPGSNSRLLASIVAGAVLGGELSVMSAIAAGHLVNSHMKYNRSSKDITKVGTVGGGTQLASQSACLNLLGVKGASRESPGSNSRLLASIVAGAVLGGELSVMSAIAAGHLVNSHMKYNRSSKDITKVSS